MSKVNSFETSILELIFNNTAIANIGDAPGLQPSSTDGSLYLALFTSDPTDIGTVSGEADYTGYARVAVVRTSAGWAIASGVASNVAAITFGACTAGNNDITHFGVATGGTTSVVDLLYHGSLDSSLAVSSGITPEIAIGDLTVTED